MDLIYCAGSNRRLMQIASDAGFLIGVRSDKQSYDFPISFVDIHYKAPKWSHHLRTVARLRPRYAIVPDLSDQSVDVADIARAVRQARELAAYCEIPLIVPKLPGQIRHLPADLAIAFSIPTSYGGARFGLHELAGRRVHLLGGNPRQQRIIYHYLANQGIAEVISVDGNMAQKSAQKATYWDGSKWVWHPESGSHKKDLMYECWQLSCRNIQAMWQAHMTREQEAA